MNDNSESLFFNVVREKHEAYKAQIQKLLSALSDNNQANKLKENKALNQVSKELSSIIAEKDRPLWLVETIKYTEQYSQRNNKESVQAGSGWILLRALMKNYSDALNHSWDPEGLPKGGHDFDQVFEQVRSNTSVPDLFDSMILALNKILETGEVDSIRAVNALNEVIETLSQNKEGSYFSTVASWKFVKSFTKNCIWESLDSVPILKQAKAAFEKTVEDMDLEMNELHEQIGAELKNKFNFSSKEALTSSENPLLDEIDD